MLKGPDFPPSSSIPTLFLTHLRPTVWFSSYPPALALPHKALWDLESVCVAGGLADREDERGQLHGVVHARRHASERERVHHEGVQIGSQVSHTRTRPDSDPQANPARPGVVGAVSDHCPLCFQSGFDLDRRVGSRFGRSSGVPDHKLRPAQQQRALHPQVTYPSTRRGRGLMAEGSRGHQFAQQNVLSVF